MSTKRDELEALLGQVAGHPFLQGTEKDEILGKSDAYGDERERKGKLAGHVGACAKVKLVGQKWLKCGDGWRCPDAPTEGQA